MTKFIGIFTGMDLGKILRRIQAQLETQRRTMTEVSRKATGSTETIRNWKRRVEKAESPGASIASLSAIAEELKVPLPWLMGEGPDDLQEYLGGEKRRARLLELYDQLRDPQLQAVALKQLAALVPPSEKGPDQASD
jgi:hypothetical protein